MKKLISLVSMCVFAFAVMAMAAQEKKAEKKSEGKAKGPALSWATGTVSSASADSVMLNNVKPAGKAKEVAGASGDSLTLNVDTKTKVTAAKSALGHALGVMRVIHGRGRVRAQVIHLVPGADQLVLERFFEEESGVVCAQRDAHAGHSIKTPNAKGWVGTDGSRLKEAKLLRAFVIQYIEESA